MDVNTKQQKTSVIYIYIYLSTPGINMSESKSKVDRITIFFWLNNDRITMILVYKELFLFNR